MTAKIFDGKEFALKKEKILAKRVRELARKGRVPKLVSIVVGDNPASHMYVNLKGEAAARVGIKFEKLELKITDVITAIRKLNEDESVTGIMVQLPLPDIVRQETDRVLGAIAPEKDVDGLTGKGRFLPATVKAVLDILEEMKVDVIDKPVVVVGRSRIVGKPLAVALADRGAKVTVAHSQTTDLGEVTRKADILVSATGKQGLITATMVKPGAIVIDVGEPKGDVAERVWEVASYMTPVPGGVGPVTVVSLLENLVKV